LEAKEKVIFRDRAKQAVLNIVLYIELKGYPETAEKFAVRLVQFGYSLANFPDKYPICKKLILAKRNLHCAVFDKNYIFIYKVINKRLVIYNVINVRTYNI
jgi:plasmid stabilization system protein ParE